MGGRGWGVNNTVQMEASEQYNIGRVDDELQDNTIQLYWQMTHSHRMRHGPKYTHAHILRERGVSERARHRERGGGEGERVVYCILRICCNCCPAVLC